MITIYFNIISLPSILLYLLTMATAHKHVNKSYLIKDSLKWTWVYLTTGLI